MLVSMSRTSRSRMGSVPPAPTPSGVRPSSTDPSPRSKSSAPVRTVAAKQSTAPVPDGIDHNAQAIATFGPIAALIPMTVGGLVSVIALWGSQSTLRGLIGFALAIMSCPTLPIIGLPFVSGGMRWFVAIISSAVVWIAVGALSARRATSRAVAGWPEWRREWLRIAIGIWIGSFAGFVVAGILLAVDF